MTIPTVLGCVAAIFAWMLQCQNGGLLNVFLKPVPSTSRPNATSFDVQTNFSVMRTQAMDMVWGRLTKADLTVLAALPPELGGGEEGVKEAIEHPNQEGKLIVAFILCLVFASLGLVAIFVFSLIYCICWPSGAQYDSQDEYKDEKILNSSTENQNFICYVLHILAFVATALLLVGLAVCIGYYIGAAKILGKTLVNSHADDAEVIGWLEGRSISFSIARIIDFLTSNFEKFRSTLSQSAKRNLNVTVIALMENLQNVDPLRNIFNPRRVWPVPPTAPVILNKQYPKLQSHLRSELKIVREELQAMQKSVMGALQVEPIRVDMNKLIGTLEDLLTKRNAQLDTVTTEVSGYLGKYSGLAKAILCFPCVLCLLVGGTFLIVFILYIFEALQRNLFSPTGGSASEVSGTSKTRSLLGGAGFFFICSGLFLVPIILLGLVAVITVTVGGFLHAELCPYVASSNGIRMTDYASNSKMEVMWNDVIPSQIPRGSGTGGNTLAGTLNLKAPQNPLHAVAIGCNPENAGPTSKLGLLAQMGIDNLVNTTALLESVILTEIIDNVKANLVDGIGKAKLDDVISQTPFEKEMRLLKILLTANESTISKVLDGPLNSFTASLLDAVSVSGNEAFASLTHSLLPCGSLHYAVRSVVFMGCGPAGLAPRVFAWGLFISLCLFFTFFSLLSLCLLWHLQNYRTKRFAGSAYSVEDEYYYKSDE